MTDANRRLFVWLISIASISVFLCRLPDSDDASSEDDCSPVWRCVNHVHAFGGRETPSGCFSTDPCLECCSSERSCVGVDIDYHFNPAKCFTYYSVDQIGLLGPAFGVTNCRIVAYDCTSASSTTATATSTDQHGRICDYIIIMS